MEGKLYIEISKINANSKEKYIPDIINLSYKIGIEIPERVIRVMITQELDCKVKPSKRIQENIYVQRKIKSFIKKDIGLEEKEIHNK